jgi:hypothetical protein
MSIQQSTKGTSSASDPLTATFLSSYVWLLLELLTVNLTIGDCILGGSTVDFCQREILMKLDICSNKAQFVSKGLN